MTLSWAGVMGTTQGEASPVVAVIGLSALGPESVSCSDILFWSSAQPESPVVDMDPQLQMCPGCSLHIRA